MSIIGDPIILIRSIDGEGGKKFYSISVYVDSPYDDDTASATPSRVGINGDRVVELQAIENEGFFDYWEIDGDYNYVDGDPTSTFSVIEVESDLAITAHFI